MTDLRQSEYEALRATIRERGTMRLWAVLAGLSAWGALAISVLITELQASITLVPLILLAATFEVNFFVHTGVEQSAATSRCFTKKPPARVDGNRPR